jgi:hypothetical protein
MPGSFHSRIFTNSFAGKEREMAFPLIPKHYFGFQTKPQYSYNVYHQLANNGPGVGSRMSRWNRNSNNMVQFIPPNASPN